MYKLTDEDFVRLSNFTKKKFGINLDKKKVLLETRLSTVLSRGNYRSFKHYIDNIIRNNSDDEVITFLNKITTNHTFFFRENEHFLYLNDIILPFLERTVADKDIRIWSAGCSSGQEAYTVAMIIDTYFGNKKSLWDTQILASDISVNSMKKGRQGIYTEKELEGIPKNFIDKYFNNLLNQRYEICDKIKKEVVFKKINLMDPFLIRKPYDLILCRNVMIYYDDDTKAELIKNFYNVTSKTGFLFIGHSENINRYMYKYKNIQPAIYMKGEF